MVKLIMRPFLVFSLLFFSLFSQATTFEECSEALEKRYKIRESVLEYQGDRVRRIVFDRLPPKLLSFALNFLPAHKLAKSAAHKAIELAIGHKGRLKTAATFLISQEILENTFQIERPEDSVLFTYFLEAKIDFEKKIKEPENFLTKKQFAYLIYLFSRSEGSPSSPLCNDQGILKVKRFRGKVLKQLAQFFSMQRKEITSFDDQGIEYQLY